MERNLALFCSDESSIFATCVPLLRIQIDQVPPWYQ